MARSDESTPTVRDMPTPIVMNVWPSGPHYLTPAEWADAAIPRTIAVLSFQALCALADVAPGIHDSYLLERHIHVLWEQVHLCPAGQPNRLGVALPGYRGREADALRILETLAYGFMDPAARATVRGRGLYLPAPK